MAEGDVQLNREDILISSTSTMSAAIKSETPASDTSNIASSRMTDDSSVPHNDTSHRTHSAIATDQLLDRHGAASSNGKRSVTNEIDSGLETGFYKMMLSPMLDEMQKSVDKNNEILDDMIAKMAEDREKNRKRQLSAHIPHLLQGRGQDLQDIMGHVEKLIEYENYELEGQDTAALIPACVRDLDQPAKLAVLGHSVAAYVSTLEGHHLKNIANKIVTDVTSWLSTIFRFPNSSLHIHEEEREGLTRICRLALLRRFPRYTTDGYEVLYPRPPVIYISSAAKHNLGQFLCHQLGLPLACVCTVPSNIGYMDVNVLQKLIEDDITGGKTPALVVTFAGTPLLGRTDNISKLCDICQKHDIWLHVEGSSLTMLAASPVPHYINSVSLASSFTLNIGPWLALPAVPFATLFRSPDIQLTRAAFLSTFNVRYRMNCLSLWMCLLNFGYDRILARLQYHTHLATMLHSRVGQIQTSNQLVLFDIEGPCLIVRYQRKSDKHHGSATTSDLSDVRQNEVTTMHNGVRQLNECFNAPIIVTASTLSSFSSDMLDKDPYFDTLNIWLVETLRREAPEIHVSAVEVENFGLCIRYAPLETSYTLSSCNLFETSIESVERFVAAFAHNIEILDATVSMRSDFEEIVQRQDNMRIVHLPSWAGLGAVQYIPDAWLNDLAELPEQGKNEINVLNHQMVNQLKSTDTAFSLGQTESGLYCVRFGLVTEDTDLEELIATVYTAGKDVEESSKFIESMSDVVKYGIEQAAIDLMKENQDKLLHEGVLRQVPIVGSLINWWSPPPKDPIKGRTFNLASGKIVSTEDTYKYHMQIQDELATNSLHKLRDGPLKTSLKPATGHQSNGRNTLNSSASSVASHNDTPRVTEDGESHGHDVKSQDVSAPGDVNTRPEADAVIG